MDSLKHYLADDGSVDNDSNASVDGGTSEDYDIYQNLEIEPDNELYGNGTEAHDANEDDVGLYDDLDQVDQQISTIEVKTPISVFGNYYLCERFVCPNWPYQENKFTLSLMNDFILLHVNHSYRRQLGI